MDFDVHQKIYDLFMEDCPDWNSQGQFVCFRIFGLDTERISKKCKTQKLWRTRSSFWNGQEFEFWISGVKIMGLGSWVRKSGLGLLGWKMGYSYGHFENSPKVGR